MTERSARASVGWLRSSLALCASLVALLALVALHLANNPRFFYWDDVQHGIMPLLQIIGARLHEGDWPLVTLRDWQSGDLLGEGYNQLFNPISLALVYSFAWLPTVPAAAAVYSTAYLLIACAGMFAFARRLGATPMWSAAAGFTYATSPFVFYWLAASWTNGLISVALLPWAMFWLSSPRPRAGTYLALAGASFLIAASGWIHGLLTLVALVAAFTLLPFEWPLQWARLRSGMAAAAGVLAAAPQLIATAVAVHAGARPTAFGNAGLLTTSLDGLAGMTWPFFLHTTDWGSPIHRMMPSPPIVYGGWFVVIGLLVAFDRDRGFWRRYLWLWLPALVLALSMMGPDQLGPIRWPLRFASSIAVVAIPLAAVGLSQWVLEPVRVRTVASIGAVYALPAIFSWQQAPWSWYWQFMGWIVFAAVTVYFLCRNPLQRWVRPAVPAFVLVLLVPVWFALKFESNSALLDWGAPDRVEPRGSISAVSSTAVIYWPGQYYDNTPVLAMRTELPSGNIRLYAGERLINGYSPVEPVALKETLCSHFWGWTCGNAVAHLLSRDDELGRSRLDLMRVDKLIVQNKFTQALDSMEALPGWTRVESNKRATAFKRIAADTLPGTLSFVGEGLAVRHDRFTDEKEVVGLATEGTAGKLVFARAWYPGYTATLDGNDVTIHAGEGGYIVVDLPAMGHGEHELTLRYGMPRPVLSMALVIAALLLLGFLTVAPSHDVFRRSAR